MWTLLIDPGSPPRRLTVGGRIALAAAGCRGGAGAGRTCSFFALTSLYPAYHGAYGISAVTDQQLAGVVMMVEQLATLGTLAFVLLRPRLHSARLVTA